MNWLTSARSRRKSVPVVMLALATLVSATACGGSTSGGSAAGGLPETIKIVSINPTTGIVAFAGAGANKGYQLAVKEINASDLLGGSKIELELKDTKSEAQTAASEVSSAVADKKVAAVFGSVSSTEAVAMSPIAQKQGLPIVYTQAGSNGVVVGDFTYRATPLMSTYYPIMKKYLQQQGWKSIGIIYTQLTPTLQEIGSKTLPDLAKELGMTVSGSIATPATTQDFQAPIAQILSAKPDVVAVLQVGASNPTAMKQLRQAGYTGPVLGNSGASAGNLKPAGADGSGMVWPVDFNYQQSSASSQKFVKAFKAEFGENPLNYSAEAYDAAWFLARSIAAAKSTDRKAIKDAMATEAGKSSTGALGEGLTWKERTIVVPGVVVEWTGNGEKLLYEAGKQ